MSETEAVTPKTPGEAAYAGYFAESEGKSLVSGSPLPAWDEQEEPIRQAWEAAAAEVLIYDWDEPESDETPASAQADVLAAIDKFEADLGFTAPELFPDRIKQLRSRVRNVFEPQGDDEPDDDGNTYSA